MPAAGELTPTEETSPLSSPVSTMQMPPTPLSFRNKKRKMSESSSAMISSVKSSDRVTESRAASPSMRLTSTGKTATTNAREMARRRWRLLQKHVCITQW